jgi:hypothetical protein
MITPVLLAGGEPFEPFLHGEHVWTGLPRFQRLLETGFVKARDDPVLLLSWHACLDRQRMNA